MYQYGVSSDISQKRKSVQVIKSWPKDKGTHCASVSECEVIDNDIESKKKSQTHNRCQNDNYKGCASLACTVINLFNIYILQLYYISLNLQTHRIINIMLYVPNGSQMCIMHVPLYNMHVMFVGFRLYKRHLHLIHILIKRSLFTRLMWQMFFIFIRQFWKCVNFYTKHISHNIYIYIIIRLMLHRYLIHLVRT